MGYRNIYTVLSGDLANWAVVKMNREFEAEDTYYVSKLPEKDRLCTCFAGVKDTCRHRDMVKLFIAESCIDSRRAFDYDKKRWVDPPKAAMEML